MEEVTYCLVCLSTDVKLFALKHYSFDDIFLDLTQVQVKNLNLHICYECASFLRKYQQFKSKCIRAHGIWSQIIKIPKLTKSYLRTLQDQFNLASNLVFSGINTEDIVDTINSFDENVADVDVKEIELTYKNDESDDRNENYGGNDSDMSISHESDEEKPLLHLESNLEVLTHNVVNTQRNKYKTSDNEINESYKSEILIKHDKNVGWEEHPEKYRPEQIITSHRTENISFCTTLNTSNKITSPNQELTLTVKEECSDVDNVIEGRNECTSDTKNINPIKNLVVMVENMTSPISQKIAKQGKKACKTSTLKKVTKEKKQRIYKDKMPESRRKIKYDGLPRDAYLKRENDKSVEILKKHGTVTFFTQEEAKNDVLVRANSSNYRTLPFKCNLCFRGFETQKTFDSHNSISHNLQKGKYQCDNCGGRFPKKKLLANHLKYLHYFRYNCLRAGCSYACYQINKAVQHLEVHTGLKYKCKYCKMDFNVKSSMEVHMRITHRKDFENEFICDICGRAFVSVNGLNTHKVKIHFDNKNEHQGPECKECKIHFASDQAWRLHLVLSRNHEVTNGCHHCGETFENSADLAQHMKRHVRKRPKMTQICTLCGFESMTEYKHRQHMHTKHDVPIEKPSAENLHVCEICGDTFTLLNYLKDHLRVHTDARPYKCRYCDKTFKLSGGRRSHENTHTGAKIYKCKLCVREFLRDSSLRRHLQVHHHIGNAKHKCTKCDRSFFHLCELKDHFLHKHQKVPYPKKPPRKKKLLKPVVEEAGSSNDSLKKCNILSNQ